MGHHEDGMVEARVEGVAAEIADHAANARARLEAIYALEWRRVAALGHVLSGAPRAGEDLAQETFIVASRTLERDPEALRDPVWPWLRGVLLRLSLQRRRTLAREMARLIRVWQPRPPVELPTSELDVLAALETLPARMRACAVLFYVEDLSTSAVADALGCAPRTVEVHLREARRRLASQLHFDPLEERA